MSAAARPPRVTMSSTRNRQFVRLGPPDVEPVALRRAIADLHVRHVIEQRRGLDARAPSTSG